MGTKGIKGEYTGFTFNGIHTEDLGITRVSGGDRYEMDLLPNFEDKTVDVPGGDGTYYFGSLYKNREFSFNLAYDGVTEQNLRQMQQLFGDRRVHPLVLDEYPFKTYYARISSTPNFEYIAFDTENEQGYEAYIWTYGSAQPTEGAIPERIYKGEATIEFVCYDPYAHCGGSNKYLDSYSDLHQWNEVYLPLLTREDLTGFDIYSPASGEGDFNGYKLYNPGDIEAFFTLRLEFNQNGKIAANVMGIDDNSKIGWEEISKENNEDTHIMYDSKLHLFYGLKAITEQGITKYKKTGSVYNRYIDNGDFFNIPISQRESNGNIIAINLSFDSDISNYNPNITYDYLYF